MKPEYIESQENGRSTVSAKAFGQIIATTCELGVSQKALATARKACKARVKYLFSQARA